MQQMQKRLGIGFLKGLVRGAVVGFGVHLGLRWPLPSGGLLAYLFAMGVGGTAGVFGGRAPWKEGAWLEALLKMIFGVGVGALTGGILTGILVETLQQPTLALAIGGGTGVLTSTLLSVLLYDGSRPPRGEPALVLRPMVLPTEGGVILGAGGSL